jgi:hypothetical protein
MTGSCRSRLRPRVSPTGVQSTFQILDLLVCDAKMFTARLTLLGKRFAVLLNRFTAKRVDRNFKRASEKFRSRAASDGAICGVVLQRNHRGHTARATHARSAGAQLLRASGYAKRCGRGFELCIAHRLERLANTTGLVCEWPNEGNQAHRAGMSPQRVPADYSLRESSLPLVTTQSWVRSCCLGRVTTR